MLHSVSRTNKRSRPARRRARTKRARTSANNTPLSAAAAPVAPVPEAPAPLPTEAAPVEVHLMARSRQPVDPRLAYELRRLLETAILPRLGLGDLAAIGEIQVRTPAEEEVLFYRDFHAWRPHTATVGETRVLTPTEEEMLFYRNFHARQPGTVRAASSRAREELADFTVTSDYLASNPASPPDCAVCLEVYTQGELLKEMPCSHRFHRGCLLPWLNIHDTCPICRHRLPA